MTQLNIYLYSNFGVNEKNVSLSDISLQYASYN